MSFGARNNQLIINAGSIVDLIQSSFIQEIIKAKTFNGSSMVGVGITPEGINQNYVMYEFALDRGWYQRPTDVMKWINDYTSSRYGVQDTHIESAWKILKVNWI